MKLKRDDITVVQPLLVGKTGRVRIEFLGHRVANVEVACKDLPSPSRVEGLLGVNFLDNFRHRAVLQDQIT
jgi:hypothetical protein